MESRYRCHVFSDLIGIEWATFLSLGTFAFIDFVIASSLCYLLATSHTGFLRYVIVYLSGTDSLIWGTQHGFLVNEGHDLRY